MKAARIHRFGSPDVIVVEDIPRPSPAAGEVLVRVVAAGVAPWDALIREGKSKVSGPPPLTLGSDLSGVVDAVGPGVTQFNRGDEVYGVTNAQFIGAQAEYAVAAAGMIAPKPQRLIHVQAASIPVVAVTAWQMLFEHARVERGQSVMVLGAQATSVPTRSSSPHMPESTSSPSSDRRTWRFSARSVQRMSSTIVPLISRTIREPWTR